MKYRKDKYGNELSQLGYGCMRFTSKGGRIDCEKAGREIMRAIEKGVNYFDTAYAYSGSEECLGRILAENNTDQRDAQKGRQGAQAASIQDSNADCQKDNVQVGKKHDAK